MVNLNVEKYVVTYFDKDGNGFMGSKDVPYVVDAVSLHDATVLRDKMVVSNFTNVHVQKVTTTYEIIL